MHGERGFPVLHACFIFHKKSRGRSENQIRTPRNQSSASNTPKPTALVFQHDESHSICMTHRGLIGLYLESYVVSTEGSFSQGKHEALHQEHLA